MLHYYNSLARGWRGVAGFLELDLAIPYSTLVFFQVYWLQNSLRTSVLLLSCHTRRVRLSLSLSPWPLRQARLLVRISLSKFLYDGRN
jgi:hypothetical protein